VKELSNVSQFKEQRVSGYTKEILELSFDELEQRIAKHGNSMAFHELIAAVHELFDLGTQIVDDNG
jgi:hypothetical protein